MNREHKVSLQVLTFLIFVSLTSSIIGAGSGATGIVGPPVITVTEVDRFSGFTQEESEDEENATTSTPVENIRYLNRTHAIISMNLSYVYVGCSAPYPVMWTMDTLEDEFADGIITERNVTKNEDPPIYEFHAQLKIAISNRRGHIFTPKCVSVEEHNDSGIQNALANSLTLIFEANPHHTIKMSTDSYGLGKIIYYWEENGVTRTMISDGDDNKTMQTNDNWIHLECFIFNIYHYKVELYELTDQVHLELMNLEPDHLRFEQFVGFYINAKNIKSNDSTFECHAILSNPNPDMNSTSSTITIHLTDTPAPFYYDETEAEIGPGSGQEKVVGDYVYVEDPDDIIIINGTDVNNTMDVEDVLYDAHHHHEKTVIAHSKRAITFQLVRLSSAPENISTTTASTTQEGSTTSRPFNFHLNVNSQNLTIKYKSSTQLTCCINSGAYPFLDKTNLLFYRKACVEPLMCLTKKHILRSESLYSNYEYDYYGSRCRTLGISQYSYLSDDTPYVYICHFRPSEKFYSYSYSEYYWNKPSTEDEIETAWFLQEKNLTDQVELEIMTPDSSSNYQRWEKTSSYNNVGRTFYTAETTMVRCKDVKFNFAKGKYLELQWNNGTILKIPNADQHKFTFEDDQLKNITCFAPLWNSTEWISTTYEFELIKASKPPQNVAGESQVNENVTFYSRQMAKLSCDFDSIPEPEYKWTWTGSYSYVFTPEKAGIYNYFSEKHGQTATIQVTYPEFNSTLPEVQINCTAVNLAGNATKTIQVQGIRSYHPEFLHSNAHEVVVFFVHDNNAIINCSLSTGVPEPEIHWKKHGRNITTFSNYQVTSANMSSLLTFKTVAMEDEGEYTCTAVNFVGFEIKGFSVRVKERSIPHGMIHTFVIALSLLVIIILVLAAFLGYVYVSKSKKISKLQMRVEYSKTLDRHESRITCATILDE